MCNVYSLRKGNKRFSYYIVQGLGSSSFDCLSYTFVFKCSGFCVIFNLRAGSLVWVGDKEPRTGEKNEARKSEPARELLIFEFPAFADERSDLIG